LSPLLRATWWKFYKTENIKEKMKIFPIHKLQKR
jgi:hypothetical protein